MPTEQTLRTRRLILRRFVPGDWRDLAAIYGDPEVMAICKLGVRTPAETRWELAAILKHWRRHHFGLWAVTDRAGGELLGECGLRHRDDNGEVELSYGLAAAVWGRGLATEAAVAAMDHGFRETDVAEVMAIAKASNTRSHRVMEKLGMRLDKRWARDGIGRVEYRIRREQFLAAASKESSP
ncbi:MAG: GNAT family N-acetyltransferase [Alphaproteobacteria bacterium]|nr:GNAT family N-acetyltransferase [Alphaproteobacteria bacterium]